MIEKGSRFLRSLRNVQRVNMSLTRGSIARAARRLSSTEPATWEFSGFSQNGEDGVIEVLIDHLLNPKRFFVEIGSSDGLENNTAWLSLVRRWGGLWIEGDPVTASRSAEFFSPLNNGVRMIQKMVTPEMVADIFSDDRHRTPDVLSLDIDSYDYFVAEAILESGARPSIFVVEYNSALGPAEVLTVPREYRNARTRRADSLYYGVSIAAWRSLFAKHGFEFLTVELNGVNAFFVNPADFPAGFSATVKGLPYAENCAQLAEWPDGWRSQWKLISKKDFARPG